ncbi:MucR family transcriptional regulator [Camelimonas fluminis]|uniref:MucR family transcriptional regulator n=1 Tax=Camelimonas fluminis TaxID=1576911 RepID=A0ABV7UI35_9HYPH|nr:MucR family transcriptional regulator [Camelimonas fluminis]GHE79654.1 MucR family transcriptional regulator [Camelimonas fluminis]
MIKLTADIVLAYVANNHVSPNTVAELIGAIHGALADLEATPEEKTPAAPLRPAVPIRISVTPDFLICLEDGKRFKSLKRHLRTAYGMTPEDYKAKWDLPSDYPMVAPNYSAYRSAYAKRMHLGVAGSARHTLPSPDLEVKVVNATTLARREHHSVRAG